MLDFREQINREGNTMRVTIKEMGIKNRFFKMALIPFLILLIGFPLFNLGSALADTVVTVSGQGGKASQTLPDIGGSFDLNIPLTKNAVNTIVITAVDASGNKVSQEISVTQLSLDSIVVSQVTTERLSVEQVTQLVNDGVIKLADPQNYNVSKFDIVLTIADQPVSVSVPIAVPKELEQTGWETYKLPQGDGSSGGRPPNAPEVQIIVFEKYVSSPGQPKISIPGVIIIEGRIKSLKEFYNVRLLLMNTSGIFTLKDVIANIKFPDGGLSKVLPADGINSFGNILPGDGGKPGQVEKQFTIRGDEIGIRHINVNFGGTVIGPGIPEDKAIPFNGSATTEVEVKGPPTFQVKVTHPDSVTLNVPYQLKVDILNTSDIPAMYASLALDVGADAQLVKCEMDTNLEPQCTPIEGSDVRNFGNILPGKSVSEVFTINPLRTGVISSCVAASDQNISLQVLVGTIGCVVGTFPPIKGVPDGVPTVTVLPVANATGIGSDTPVTAFFSEKMDTGSITTGTNGTFTVRDKGNNILSGQLRFETLGTGSDARTVAIWQILGGLAGNMEHTVVLTKEIRDLQGNEIFNEWTSRFTTTAMGPDDTTPPTVTLSVEPPVNPNFVLPGQIVKVNAYASDQGSGIARVELRTKDLNVDGALFTLVDQKTAFQGDLPPYIFSINSANLVGGHTYQVMATAYDKMGNAQNATISLVIAASAAPPTVTLPNDLPADVLQGISVSLTPQVTGGVTEVRYYLDYVDNLPTPPFKTVNLAPYQAGLGTLNLPLGIHNIRVEAIDGLGQRGEATYTFSLLSNINMPVVNLPGLVNGAQYVTGSSFTVKADAQDPVGIKSVTLFLERLNGSRIVLGTGTQPVLVNTAILAQDFYTIFVQAYNNLDIPNSLADAASYRTFSVVPLPNGPAPAAPTITGISSPVNGQVTVTGTAVAGARVDITNTGLGITITTYANSSGAFSSGLPGDVGQGISALQYDFSTSQQPSAASTTSTVQAPPTLTSISASPSSITFSAANGNGYVNAYQDIVVTGTYSNNSTANVTSSATFSSNNPGVASVGSTGRVAALNTGTAVITASVNGVSTTLLVNVRIITLTGITVVPGPPQGVNLVAIGQTQQLAVTGLYTDGLTNWSATLTDGITYITGNPTIATVNTSGLITARANGSTQISVSRSGLPALSVAVTVNTGTDPPPTVEIFSPANGTQVEREKMVSISARAQDAIGGVTRVNLNVTGQTTYSEIRQVSPALLSTNQTFTFTVSKTAAIGGTILINLTAEDTGGNVSSPVSVTLNVVDQTAPAVAITTPANQARFNYGDTVNITVTASDAVGVTQIRYEATGAITSSNSQAFPTGPLSANASFSFTIPFGIQNPEVRILAYARDAAGNERASVPIDIVITDADITSSSTRVTSVTIIPSGNAVGTVTYEVSSGLSDLDHVELYFRRNGIGTFNRYTDADGGNPQGKYTPQNGTIGTISFDSTKMGGDGNYEFYSVGVDLAGNREFPPYDNSSVLHQLASGLVAYYPFNGNASDETGLGHDGLVQQALPTEDKLGQPNRAYTFDGINAFIDAGPSEVFNFNGGTGDFTIAALIKPASMPSYAAGIVGKATHGANPYTPPFSGWAFYIYSDGRLCIGNAGINEICSASGTISAGAWTQVAVRKNGTNSKIYKNGVEVASGNYGNLQTSGTSLRIGSVYPDSFGFNGIIDEVAVYDRALSLTEVQKLNSLAQLPVAPDQTATFSAGTVWTVINTPTFIGEGDAAIDNKNIRVTGTTLTVNGSHSFHNLELLNGAVLTHSDTTTLQEFSFDLNAWTVSVDATSSIDVTGKGYLGGRTGDERGRTVGNALGSYSGAGGSYGGLGGGYQGAVTNPVYGDLINPLDLGSGGGVWAGTWGGDGGGLIKLSAINVTNDGSIRSNGGGSAGSAAGDGSGGGINITTATISGAGTILANGGGNGSGAGGGRIAIKSIDMSTMDASNVKALGGFGPYANGANGTVVFIEQDKTALILSGQGPSSPWIDLTLPPGYVFDSVTLRDNARVIAYDNFTVTGKVWITGNSILTQNNSNESGLAISAAVVQVDAGSAIDVTGRGYLGGRTTDGSGLTLGNVSGSNAGAGGSYGGVGAGYVNRISNRTYGSLQTPDKLGSGGGAWGGSGGGDGGGRVTITASETVIVNGAIRANGSEGSSAAGAGSGGSVLIRTSRLSGDGFITANGGGNGAGGGGGRVAVHCDYVETGHNFNSLYNLTAFGGRGSYDTRRSSAGTVYLKTSTQAHGNLYVDDNVVDGSGNPNGTSPESTPLTLIGFGTTVAVTGNTLTTDGRVALLPGNLAGMRLNPDINQSETFVIQSNTEDTITVISPNEHNVHFSAPLVVAGKTYSGLYRFDNVTFRRGGNLVVGDLLEVTDTMWVGEYGLLTHYKTTTNFVNWLDLTVENLILETSGWIDVTSRGYIGGRTGDGRGLTVGNALGSYPGAGGSYGGLGGGYQGAVPNPVYGDLTNPLDLGSGGGFWGGPIGGDGGGLVLINAGNVTLNGTIRANGGESGGSAAGDGSGGGINILTGTLVGNGLIQANGGGQNNGVGGGGGRIAVSVRDSLSFSDSNLKAIGGAGQYGNAGHGTAYIKKPGQAYGEFIVDGQGQTTPIDTTLISGDLTFDKLTVQNGGKMISGGKLTVIGSAVITGGSTLAADGGLAANTVLVTGNSVVTHSSGNESGLAISAAVVQVDAGSAIDVTGRGYLGGRADSEQGRTLGNVYGSNRGAGGSYGGLGGRYDSNWNPSGTYGDLTNPQDLGSGGGAWGANDGGDGGGLVLITAGNITLNGAIIANGGEAQGSVSGAGSGGGVNIVTGTLTGDGFIGANGGNQRVGGGGGRIAIHFTGTLSLSPGGQIHALGGQGSYGSAGNNGTVTINGVLY
jgi:hypothetical protein